MGTQTDDYVATLDPVLGLVQHQTALADPTDLTSWDTLDGPILVREGDRIRTGNGALAYLTFFEGAESEIEESTLVVVSTLLLPAEGGFNISLDVLVGTLVTDVGAILDADDRFEIHTPGATAAVRGTRWWTVVAPNGESIFATERGVVDIIAHPRPMMSIGAAAPAPAADPDEALEAPPAAAAAPLEMMSLSVGVGVVNDALGNQIGFREQITFPERPARGSIAVSLVGPNCGDGVCLRRERVSCPVDCLSQVTIETCGNGTCDLESGEDLLVCAMDCGPWQGQVCGNGTCDADESGVTCPDDCAADQYFTPIRPSDCGDGTCGPTESALTCPADCRPA
jgi:hypothetical protein